MPPFSVVDHGADAVELARGHHERRVGGVDDLVARREPFVDQPQQVLLRAGVQGQAGLVEQDDQVAGLPFFELAEVGEEAEEPDEAAGPLVERHGRAVPVVVDPDEQDRSLVQRRRGAVLRRVDAELDAQVLVLRPVLEDFVGDRVAGVLQVPDQPLELVVLAEVL